MGRKAEEARKLIKDAKRELGISEKKLEELFAQAERTKDLLGELVPSLVTVFELLEGMEDLLPPADGELEPPVEEEEPPTLPAEPKPDPEGDPVSRVGKDGIDWSLRRPAEVGSFVTGDRYLVGPNVVTASPGWDGEKHGSMLNPRPGSAQGYDARLGGRYTEAWGLFDPNLTAPREVAIRPGSQLVSTIGEPAKVLKGPQLRRAEVLTCLEGHPEPGSFRPPLYGVGAFTDLEDWPNVNRLNLALLQSGVPTEGMPDPAEVAKWFRSPWLDHLQNEASRFLHPSQTMPEAYGADLCSWVGVAALMLHTGISIEAKLPIIVGLVQYGLDLYSLATGAPEFWYGSPHHSGKKLPIILAGLLLEEPSMVEFTAGWKSSEDHQTFVVDELRPEQGYTEANQGEVEWGQRHSGPFAQPEQDDARIFESDEMPAGFVGGRKPNGDPSNAVRYRTCCTANGWLGQALAASLMRGAIGAWNHPPFFEYCARYVRVLEERGRDVAPALISKSPWVLRAWHALMP